MSISLNLDTRTAYSKLIISLNQSKKNPMNLNINVNHKSIEFNALSSYIQYKLINNNIYSNRPL